MDTVQVFNFNGRGVREITDSKGEPWFIAKDVCEILGIQNTADALTRLDDDEKLNRPDLLSLGQRGGWIINESGLYSLVIRSDKPEAKSFKKWITSEVLPSIRKTGTYSINESKTKKLPSGAQMRALQDLYGNDEAKKRIDYSIGYAPHEVDVIQVVENIGRISPASYAVEMRIREKEQAKKMLEDKSGSLFC